MNQMQLRRQLRRTGQTDATVHGFRSAFTDWAHEQTTFPREVIEMSLAHKVGNAVERSYRRTDLFDRRRALMSAWASFCAGEAERDGNGAPSGLKHPIFATKNPVRRLVIFGASDRD
jgi:hypothetical protein